MQVRGSALEGYHKPSVGIRIFSISFLGTLGTLIFYAITLLLGFFFEVFVLWGRGQNTAHWLMGMEFRSPKTGQTAGHALFFGMFVFSLCITGWNAALPGISIVYALIDIICGAFDENGQTITDKIFGVVLVYKNNKID